MANDWGNGMQAREMHDTTCSKCGKPTQVPFVPKADRPVYCKDCFKTERPKRF